MILTVLNTAEVFVFVDYSKFSRSFESDLDLLPDDLENITTSSQTEAYPCVKFSEDCFCQTEAYACVKFSRSFESDLDFYPMTLKI